MITDENLLQLKNFTQEVRSWPKDDRTKEGRVQRNIEFFKTICNVLPEIVDELISYRKVEQKIQERINKSNKIVSNYYHKDTEVSHRTVVI